MRGLPYVPWFTSDWLASSARVDMSPPERAFYLDLLFQIWERGGAIPSSPAKLAKLSLATPEEFETAWPAISVHIVAHPDEPGMLTNLKMLDVIQKQASTREANSNNGRLGGLAKARNRKSSEPASEIVAEQLAKSWHPESESESESEENKNTCASNEARLGELLFEATEKDSQFATFWDVYVKIRSRAKKDAQAAFRQVVTSEKIFDAVMAGLQRQIAELLSYEIAHRPYAASWLRGARWEDEVAEQNSGAEPPQYKSFDPSKYL